MGHNKQNRYKTYDEAQEFCKNGTMNGFTTGRLLEPKTLSFLDKVYFESRIVFGPKMDTRMGIIRINSTTSYEGKKWVYASSGDEIDFQNWYSGRPRLGPDSDCALLHPNPWKNHQSWINSPCYLGNAIICEFV